jgi:hypothetical protein
MKADVTIKGLEFRGNWSGIFPPQAAEECKDAVGAVQANHPPDGDSAGDPSRLGGKT